MKPKPIEYKWLEETRIAMVTIYDDKNRFFTGVAECDPLDYDMCSEKTGYELAYAKAEISLIQQHIKDLKLEKKNLMDLYKTYKNHPKYNQEDWSIRILRKKIYSLNEDIETFKDLVRERKNDLKNYIKSKEEFYFKVRQVREKKKKQASN